MTLSQSNPVPNDFSAEALLDELPLGDHDAEIAGDTITTLHLNSEWRKFIAHAIDTYLDIGLLKASQSQLDVIDPLIFALFDDFYSPDTSSMLQIAENTVSRQGASHSIAATGAYLIWDTGSIGFSDPTRARVLNTGYQIVTVNFRVAQPPSTSTVLVALHHNGAALNQNVYQPSATNHWIHFTWQFDAVFDDYLQVWIDPSIATEVRSDLLHATMKIACWFEP